MAGTDQTAIVSLGPNDAAAGLLLSTEAHWNQNEADWRFFLTEGTVFGVRDKDTPDYPYGATFTGRAWSEPTLLRLAYALEQWRRHVRGPARRWRRRPHHFRQWRRWSRRLLRSGPAEYRYRASDGSGGPSIRLWLQPELSATGDARAWRTARRSVTKPGSDQDKRKDNDRWREVGALSFCARPYQR